MTPAEELREAAKLMRKRAEAASRGPWQSYIEGRDHCGGDSFIAAESEAMELYAYVTVSKTYNPKFAEDQDHIASWHPLVALAVADWLEETARRSETGTFGITGIVDAALRTARAYLDSEREAAS